MLAASDPGRAPALDRLSRNREQKHQFKLWSSTKLKARLRIGILNFETRKPKHDSDVRSHRGPTTEVLIPAEGVTAPYADNAENAFLNIFVLCNPTMSNKIKV